MAKGPTKPCYDDTYKVILAKQANDDRTARCYLGPATDTDSSRFESCVIQHPMEEMPFDITINSIKRQQKLSFTKAELTMFAAPGSIPEGPGVSAVTALAEDDCGIASASGVFKMKRVWTKLNPDGEFVELFEGFVSFNVTYSGLYSRKGHGSGQKTKFAFWAVRARVEKGKEVGLRPMTPVNVSAPGNLEKTDGDQSSNKVANKQEVRSLPLFASTY